MTAEECIWCGEFGNSKEMIEIIDAKGNVKYFHKFCHKEYHEWFDKREQRKERFNPPI